MMTSPENRECGTRFKFLPVQRDRKPNRYARTERFLYWCNAFDEAGMAPMEGGASAGNLSFRTPAGFVITPTRARLKAGMGWESLVEVVRSDWHGYALHYLGERPPSSDSFLHGKIFAVRPDVEAVFHGHDDSVLRHAGRLAEEFDIACPPREIAFGTREDAEETATALGGKGYLIRKGHGFVAVGRTLDEAGQLAIRIHRRAVELSRDPDSP